MRIYQKNIWNDALATVAVKIHEQKEIGVDAIVPLKKDFKSEEDALQFVGENLSDQYSYEFEFVRTGWQYDLGENQVDLERVDSLKDFYTVEFKSDTIEGLIRLKTLLKIKDVVRGPIAFHIKDLIQS